MSIRLSSPSVTINDILIGVTPESVSINMGHGEIKVTAESLGAGLSRSIHSYDATGQVGNIKFTTPNTQENANRFDEVKQIVGGNVVVLTFGDFQYTLNNSSLTNSPDNNLGSEGSIEFDFKGDQVKKN